jgi:hypothetical protein
MARGRKTQKNTSARVADKPPAGLTKAEAEAYRRIRSQVTQTSGTGITAADQTILVLAASQLARVEALRCEAAVTPWMLAGSASGQERIHPIHTELRATEAQLKSTLTTLCLTPRARKGWRAQPDAIGAAADQKVDPILKLLG